jgi:hypothetical protein
MVLGAVVLTSHLITSARALSWSKSLFTPPAELAILRSREKA